MIEYWAPKSEKAAVTSSEELGKLLDDSLAAQLLPSGIESAAKGVMSFINRLHTTPGVVGASISFVHEPPAPAHISFCILAPMEMETLKEEDNWRIMEAVSDAKNELDEKLECVMRARISYYNTIGLEPESLTDKFRRDMEEGECVEFAGTLIFRR